MEFSPARAVGSVIPTITQLTFQRGRVRSARFAPDGRTVVYAASWNGEPFSVFSTRTDVPDSRPLETGPADLLAISSNGELALALAPTVVNGLYGFRGALARVSLLGGSPREVLENVSGADWNAQGTDLAIIREPERDGRQTSRLPIGDLLDRARTRLAAGRPRSLVTAVKTGSTRALQALGLTGQQRLLLRTPSVATIQDIAPDGRVLLTPGACLARRPVGRGPLRRRQHAHARADRRGKRASPAETDDRSQPQPCQLRRRDSGS